MIEMQREGPEEPTQSSSPPPPFAPWDSLRIFQAAPPPRLLLWPPPTPGRLCFDFSSLCSGQARDDAPAVLGKWDISGIGGGGGRGRKRLPQTLNPGHVYMHCGWVGEGRRRAHPPPPRLSLQKAPGRSAWPPSLLAASLTLTAKPEGPFPQRISPDRNLVEVGVRLGLSVGGTGGTLHVCQCQDGIIASLAAIGAGCPAPWNEFWSLASPAREASPPSV